MVLSNRKLKQQLREKIADSQLTFEIVKSDPVGGGGDNDWSGFGSGNPDPNSTPRSFRELLGSKTPKPSLSKRAKRRKLAALRAPPPASGSGGNNEVNNGQIEKKEKSGELGLEGNVDLNKEIGFESVGAEKKSEALSFEEKSENGLVSLGKKKKEKKRKRDEEVKSENGLVSLGKKEKEKKRKRDEEVKSGDENVKEEDAKKPKKKKPKWKKKKEAKNSEEDKKGFEIVSEGKKGVEIVSQVQSVIESPMETEREVNVEVATKVYVGGIPYYSTEDDIRSYFESCGSITEIDCMTFPDSGKFKGIAIISFRTEAAAKRALALDGADMGGLFLKILPYKATRVNKVVNKVSDFAPKIVEGYNRIYVGNLSWDITEDELKKLFSDCKISSINFGLDKETGEFKGYAHVEFADSLSLTMALELDQKVVLGRPVKISCAVPLRKPGIQPKSLSTTTGIVSRTVAADASEEADNAGLSSGKLKRRTCYECGEKGHVSSLCPKKKPADVIDTKPTYTKPVMTTSSYMDYETTSTHLDSATATTESADAGLSSLSGKTKRRTCYECGEKGHLSTACPWKQSAAAKTHTNAYTMPVHTVTNPVLESAAITPTAGVDNNTGLSSVGGKTKKRTCYECGEKGHVSTACPLKQSAHPTNTAPTHKPPVQTPTPAMDSTATTTTFTGAEPDTTGLNSISGKVKRRTCYECGEKGHISSACPKKAIC